MDAERNAATAPATAPRRRKRRWWLFLLVLFVLGVPALLPYALNLPAARRFIAREASRALDAECRIDRLSFSWFRGFELDGVEIANAAGFDPSHPLLAFDSLRGDLSLTRLLRGRLDLSGTLAGLELFVDQDDAGRTNLGQLLESGAGAPGGGRAPRDGGARRTRGLDLADVRLDLALTGAALQIRRGGELLESLRDVDCRLEKEFGNSLLRALLDARMAPTRGENEGRLHLRAELDGQALAGRADLETSGLDLSRYEPLAAAFLAPGALTAIGGVVDGHVTAHFQGAGAGSWSTQGSLTITAPRLAGSFVDGLDVRGERWTLKPDLVVDFTGAEGPPQIDGSGLDLDLGFLRVRGLDDAALRPQLAGGRGLGCAFTLDLAAFARMAGQTAVTGGTVAGTAVLPLPGDALPEPAALVRALVADAELRAVRAQAGGFSLADLGGALTLRAGALALATAGGTVLNGGPLRLELRAAPAAAGAAAPFDLRLDWNDGKVRGDAVPVVRHLVPLLAGLDQGGGGFAAGIDLGLQLRGPLWPLSGENVLQWLDHWSGTGNLGLTDGSFVPAPAMQGLLAMLRQQDRIAIDKLEGAFTLKEGRIETEAMRWISKGQPYGLRGTVGLDGALDFGLDLTALLQQHRDGKVIAALLGAAPLRAGLTGTLDAPALALPDLARLAKQALEKAPAQLLEQQGQELLRQQLERLFGRKKN